MSETKALTISRHLPVKLDQYRRNALSEEQAIARREEIRITEHLGRVKKSLDAEIKEQQRKQNIASECIVQGFEMKEVSCTQEVDFERKVVRVVRLDTNEMVEERALTADEIKHFRKVP